MTFPKSFQVGGNLPIPFVISNKTAAYTVQATDAGTIINCTSGTFTVSLTAAATLASGFNVQIINTGTGTITIDPSGAETLDANTTWQLSKGQGVSILCDGTNFQTIAIRTSGQSANSVALGNHSGGAPSVAITGSGAMALGGSYASGTDSFAAAISNNTSNYGATGPNCVAIGPYAKASNGVSIAIGPYATATGYYSLAIGFAMSNSGPTATQSGSVAVGGDSLSAIKGKYAYACGYFSANGDAQTGTTVLRRATTDATPSVLTTDKLAVTDALTQVILANNQAMTVSGTVICRQSVAGSDKASGWTFTAVIRRGATAASTALVAAVTPILVAQDVSLATTVVAVTADTTNGGLAVTVTGIAATNLRWVATINTSEVIYA